MSTEVMKMKICKVILGAEEIPLQFNIGTSLGS